MREVYIHTCIVQSTNNSAGSAVPPGPFSFKIIIDELLPKGLISKELEKCFVPLMEHVVKGFEEKYYEEGLH